VRYRLQVRLGPADVGRRVVIRWRRPAQAGGDEIADVLGVLEAADAGSFTVRTPAGESVVIPARRALAGKIVPAASRRGRPA
jgi:N-acetylglutamate synthase